ncbi:MAG: TfoX/Sxy family protein [Candidatus Tectomicrobia bacterium]|uniref:TfoX/Sxy family protein n=1 Tax=Tectimicrobiota bacterium TaxID=2528274 RepID=A0A932MMT1_UNCTE|nr:TfoX/Sxy family protein [Candidatus Tectomicrobia bacterium]
MAYDEKLAARVRRALAGRRGIEEKKMFGGLTFMLRGHMCCGVLKDDLILRVGPGRAARALRSPHARPFDFTGRPMTGIVAVAPSGCRAAALRRWLALAEDFASSLPPK